MRKHIVRLRGKAHECLIITLGSSKRRGDVRIFHQLDRHVLAALLLDLLERDLPGAVIRRRGGLDDDVLLLRACQRPVKQLLRRHERHDLHALRRLDGHRPGEQRHLRAAPLGCACNGVAHFAGGTVGDVADGIERLPRRAGRHHDAQALHVALFSKHVQRALRDHYDVLELARAAVPAGQMARRRGDDVHAARDERRNVLLRRGIFPHAGVHRRGDHHRRAGRHDGRGKHVVRDAARHLADDVGRRRGDQEEIRALGQRDMLDLPGVRAHKRVRCHRMTGERLKRQRRHKLACVLRHHHKHVNALLLQQTQNLACLICSDAPGHAEDNALFGLQVTGHRFQQSAHRRSGRG